MYRYACAALAAAMTFAVAAVADEDDGIYGNYLGSFSSGAHDGKELKVEVISLGDDAFRGRLFVDGSTEPVALEGGLNGDGAVALTGDGFQGSLKDGTLTGKAAGSEFTAKRTILESPTLGLAAPEGAVVLYDSTHLDEWIRWPEKWPMTESGSFRITPSDFVTKRMFGDATYHIEFMTPFMPDERGQGRGNSGVYIQGRYEVQVLDSFGEDPAWDYCGGIYKQSVPSTNASYPPLTWQTYDIEFTAPRFDANNAKTANARITVTHNGVVIHDDVELTDRTPGGMGGPELPVERLLLQDHRDGVEYRNIWVLEKK